MFHVKLAEWARIVQLSLRVMDITAKLLDKFGRAPYPEGMRGGWVNTNIWLLGVGISLIKRESRADLKLRGFSVLDPRWKGST